MIKDLIKQMTLEEKAGLCSGADFWHTKAVERLGIPAVMVTDGPHGLRKQEGEADHLGLNQSVAAVCFSPACASASSFDENLLYRMGSALGEECRSENIAILLGPAVNIKRSPLCGRNFEYFSEDPYLTGKLSSAQIKGIQEWEVGTSLKHYAVNNQETYRMTCSSEVDERTLREIYLAGFEMAVKEAGPWTVMSSYNKINGEYASENKKLLTDILREEWGFEGFVMSDWGAVNDRVKSIEAGLELEMPSSNGIRDEQIVKAVREGLLPEELLDLAVERILKVIFQYSQADATNTQYDIEEHHKIATDMAKECAVLLKNEGALPLSRQTKVAYIGAFAKIPRYQGGGSSHIHASRVTNALDTGRDKNPNIIYAEGFPHDKDLEDQSHFEEAVKAASKADAAVIFAGLPESFDSEGIDRKHMRLPECQNRLIEQIAGVQKNTIVVLHNGSAVEVPWADKVNAILEMFLAGQGVGEATDALLYADANPCGRLAETFPLRLEDTPSYLNFPGDGKKVVYSEGIYIGYRYYEAKKIPVLFPFGHGLSYTEFSYHDMQVTRGYFTEGESITVTAQITNSGKMAGKEVVQLYVGDRTGTPGRPVKELKGFAKVELKPGETKSVTFEIDARSLSWYNEEIGDWYAAGGTYELLLAHSSAEIRLSEKVKFTPVREIPFRVDENTTIGSLLKNPKTAPIMSTMLSKSNGGNASGFGSSNEMLKEMTGGLPLRALFGFSKITEDQMKELIYVLKEQLK
ncbi:MAG TPA: glycosyl hydrolase [Lachnoclostridium phytofermentans]|uniref:Glycosyl hydrolase n=1 Tax=Lachnoclostridium phytofermentans TaxID=66219 RepID=A0A3D2X8V0_9FIRM|nr:glycoside hydrolase family 3 C-terminal domain-containing protein [Lachnoclostridium sp.]HCL03579.1 glycosyl hydrolase [Lachnoclostridium phytofermentans]